MTKHSLTSSPIKLFADDIKMYHIVNNLNNAIYFQSILNSINYWCTDSQLSLNYDKCFILHLGKSNTKFSYGLNGVLFPSPDQVKDLGVFIDSSLSFSKHIAATCSKARSRCSLFLKSFISRDLFSMKQFYISYIRPLLEYSSPVWSPITQGDINALESVQRFYTNRVPCCTFLPYKRRLEILAIDSLQKRRQIADLVCLFSIINGSTNTFLHPYLNFELPSITRSHNLRICKPLLNLSLSYQNLIYRSEI